ncbi:hydroxymethylglutaryl-CoA reductase, degradative [Nocardiopsis sp. MG754419]|uniref:hydroxymethylglutaryl-CoA reductase, degradative n=1 Tax=Nocardiopsis sp. MG754419 TaxID=2259865 RepID=UPI001BA60562|nr:hydroxymethylglutaryl-CoA reductase, degradative [Nocardiopsis sp. MG754419]MBR8742667.1 hydroxymethylglutaryl-CoA reductase, degradative [Nocardiopsis sp. MG754419]
MARNSRLSGFRDLDIGDRRRAVARECDLPDDALDALDPGGLDLETADRMIENTVGVLGVPVGVATNVTVNGRDVLVPMATEEPSVVAAASNAARIARVRGGFTTTSTVPVMQAQVQVVDVVDPQAARLRVLEAREEIIALAQGQDPTLTRLGGGVVDLTVRTVPTGDQTYVVAHIAVDVRDAMGANAVNTMAEAIAPRVAELAQGRPLLRILTNRADRRISRARAVLDPEALGGAEVARDIVHAYRLAAADPYRAATHNKGIMNGVSAVVLATGNDTRAVEAGAHAHAVDASGRYTSLSTYELDADGAVVATLELPTPVGLVGGATRTHPAARAALALTGVTTASELGELIVAVGLAQNIAALRALATEGIQRGHMSLHARNIAVAAGAEPDEVAPLTAALVADRSFGADHAEAVLARMRGRA